MSWFQSFRTEAPDRYILEIVCVYEIVAANQDSENSILRPSAVPGGRSCVSRCPGSSSGAVLAIGCKQRHPGPRAMMCYEAIRDC